MSKAFIIAVVAASTFSTNVAADVIQLHDASELSTQAFTATFEGFTQGTRANDLYAANGLQFRNVGTATVPVFNWGAATSSPDFVIATARDLNGSVFTPYLDAVFSQPVYEVGAYFGNDPFGLFDFTQSLEVFNQLGDSLGIVSVLANFNRSVDQFIGLRSAVPFYTARFSNSSSTMAVVLDDVSFTAVVPVPEPPTCALALVGLAGLFAARRGTRPV